MSKAPAFQFYAGDFFVDTISWSLEEIGAYARLLSLEWANGPLENDPKKLAQSVGLSGHNWKREWDRIWTTLSSKFSQISLINLSEMSQNSLSFLSHLKPYNESLLINVRLEETRGKQLIYSESRRKGAQAKHEKDAAYAEHMHVHKPCSPTPTPTPHKEKTKKTFSSDSDEFRLSSLLFNLLRDRKPDIKNPDMQSWAHHIDLMLRVDKRLPERIKTVIEWCQKDTFWQNNILSTAKLREKYDQLTLKMGGSNGGYTGSERKTEGKTSAARNFGDGAAYPCDLEVTE